MRLIRVKAKITLADNDPRRAPDTAAGLTNRQPPA
jgi:hypothetical protein